MSRDIFSRTSFCRPSSSFVCWIKKQREILVFICDKSVQLLQWIASRTRGDERLLSRSSCLSTFLMCFGSSCSLFISKACFKNVLLFMCFYVLRLIFCLPLRMFLCYCLHEILAWFCFATISAACSQSYHTPLAHLCLSRRDAFLPYSFTMRTKYLIGCCDEFVVVSFNRLQFPG